jgi:hypothetical protein
MSLRPKTAEDRMAIVPVVGCVLPALIILVVGLVVIL